MKKIILLFLLFFGFVGMSIAQRTIEGLVTDTDGMPLIGANVLVPNTTVGTITDIDGTFSLDVPERTSELEVSYTGFGTQTLSIVGIDRLDVALSEGEVLDEVVVTALGIKKEKKTLGYATEEVGGDEVTRVKDANFINSLSGKVSGVNVKRSNNLGGSSNVIIRGYTSLSGNNQALFVVDGVPLSNNIDNSTGQSTGRGGYDFGNAASDINPEDIESMSVLKGAAATALYGSRAANGVVLITTKKGAKNKTLGITFNTGVTIGNVDKSTLPKYQKRYGPGYGPLWYGNGGGLDSFDFGNGDVLTVPTYEDASYGQEFDPSIQVADWRSYYKELDTYGQTFPFVASDNDATTYFEQAVTYNNNVSISGGTDKSTYRLSYTNFDSKGILPNSNIKKNTVSFSGGYDVTERFNVSSSVNFVNTQGEGRYGTGYDNRNPNQSFRQWYQVNADFEALKDAYEKTGLNLTWNPKGANDPGRAAVPNFFDNPYFNANENVPTDERNRIFGNVSVSYELTDWLSATGRIATDRYNDLQEERIAFGSVDVPMYSRYNSSVYENNFDGYLSADKYFGDINIQGLVGFNIRRSGFQSIFAETNGGLVSKGLYSLSNSVSPLEAPTERDEEIAVNGYYGRATFGYKNYLYLDLTARNDISSTLPDGENSYFYPSASISYVFSELINSDIIDFGKIRLNYAEVGSDAPFASVRDNYVLGTPFNGTPLASVSSTKNNAELKPERTESLEAGLEMNMFSNRFGFDVTFYQASTFDQILPVTVTAASGQLNQYFNAGQIDNNGIELGLKIKPVVSDNFEWNLGFNWTKNNSEVVELYQEQKNLQLASFQGGVTVNATKGEPYGALWGTNYVYHNGQPIVTDHKGGVKYVKTSSPEVIGNINPDWKAGISNGFKYKGVGLNFLIDIQKGGDFFSLDTYYGFATGLYDWTAENNRNGNPIRDKVEDGGGYFIDGAVVQTGTDPETGAPISDGTVNETAFYMGDYNNAFGYKNAPNAYHIYDASYGKLREIALSYSIPGAYLSNTPFAGLDISLVGRNVAILWKNSPYSDPEDSLSAGNFQGYQSGSYPSVKEYGINLKFKF